MTAALPMSGLQIRSVSAYAEYDSSSVPNNGGGLPVATANLPFDVGAGGSISIAWSEFTDRTSFSLSYTPSYTGSVRYSSLNALNHAFFLNTTRKLAPRWTFGFSVQGNYSNLQESVFAPTTLSNVASVPSNANDLAAALLASKFTNNQQLGVLLTNSPVVESPVANLLYGQRMFTASGQGNLSYSVSPRLNIKFSGGGGRTQNTSQNLPDTPGTAAVIPNTTSATANVSVFYSLSPTTQIGGMASVNWVSSTLEESYTTTSQATFGRTLGRQWFMQIHGGVGVTNPVRQMFLGVRSTPDPVVGGSLGFKTGSSTILALFERTASDSYGVGAASSLTSSATWRWHHPGSLWSVESNFNWQKLSGNASSNISGWRATAGLNRAFGPHLVLAWQYAYLKYSGGLLDSSSSLSQSAVRMSMIWMPQLSTAR